MQDIQIFVNELVSKLQKRRIEGSDTTAVLTAELLRSVISQQKMSSANQAEALIEAVRDVGVKLVAANPVELAVGNIASRVLHIIREEDLSLITNAAGGMGISIRSNDQNHIGLKDDQDFHIAAIAAKSPLRSPSLHSLLERLPDSGTTSKTCNYWDDSKGKGKSDKNASLKLKNHVLEAVNYLIEDIKNCHEQIAEQAMELIHQNEVILTFGLSACCNKEKLSIQVFVAEGAPKYQGHVLAKDLAASEIKTTLVADSAIFAMISRVNTVVVGVHAVIANGGVMGPVGLNMVAPAAKRHAVPFVVVAGCH